MMKHWLILYDITSPRRLQKTAKVLEGLGLRVQKSVFEAEAKMSTIRQIKAKIADIIDNEKDYVLFFSLCQRDWEKREKYGVESELPAVQEFQIF